jgi:hypothetical protein
MKNTKIIKLFLLFTFTFITGCNDYAGIDEKSFNETTFCSDRKYGHVIVLIDRTSKLTQAQYEEIKKVFFSKDSSALFKKYDKGYKFSYFLINSKKPAENNLIFSKCKPNPHWSFTSNEQILDGYNKTFYSDIETNALVSTFKNDGPSDNSFIYETISWIAKGYKSDFSSDQSYREIIVVSDLMQKSEKLDLYKICNAKECQKIDNLTANNRGLKDFLDFDFNDSQREDNKKINISFYILTTCDTNPSRNPRELFSFWQKLLNDQKFNITDRTPRIQQTENTKNTCDQARY